MSTVVRPKMALATKFYLMLVLPLIVISALVTWVTYLGLDSNASTLSEALKIQGKTNSVLALQLAQDDASKAILIDPSQLEVYSTKKIEAYDAHKKLLDELKTEVTAADMQHLITELSEIDEQKLRPLDSRILELLFDNVDKARTLYFGEYEPIRQQYEKLVRQLDLAASTNAQRETVAMRSKNATSLLQIALALVLGIGVVATTITILSKQIVRSEANTRSLLAVLSEGLFFFGSDGRIAAERSESLPRIIPGSDRHETIEAFVTAFSQVTASSVQTCLKLLWAQGDSDFFSDFDSTMSFLPKELRLNDRMIQLEYRPLYDAQAKLEKVVVVAADVTEKLKNERQAIHQAERVRKISRVAASLDSYLSFFEESVALFRRADGIFAAKSSSPANSIQLNRDLHTLKGSIGTFDFTSLAHEIHELETLVEDEGYSATKAISKWEQIKDQWKFETSDIEQVLGLKASQGKVGIAKFKLDRLSDYARTAGDGSLKLLLADALRCPLPEIFGKYASYLDKLAERHEDKQVRFVYVPDSDEISFPEAQRLDAAFVHIFRNCFDHGIEPKETRLKAGKAATGTIHVACYRKANGTLHFVLKDDGQGINGDKLVQKAIARGLWTPERAAAATLPEKIDLIFVSNLSTRDDVTELSGRGVGMDAVKGLLESLGGSISAYSQAGLGTQFEIDVPTAETPAPPVRLAAV